MIILVALFLWWMVAFGGFCRYSSFKNVILNGVLSLWMTGALASFLFFFSLIGHVNFMVFQWSFLLLGGGCLAFLWRRHWFSLKEIPLGMGLTALQTRLLMAMLLVFTILFSVGADRWGEWDAWAIWMLHAKFLLFENHFTNLFTNDIFFTHPDYPLMLSSLIAFVWKSLGHSSPVVPLVVAYVTGLSLLLGMAASLFELTYRKLGLAIVFVFTFSNLLFSFSHSQYADTLLSLFIVCSFVFYHHRNTGNAALLPLMAGFFAASAGWVKNEGLLFFGLFSCFYLVYNVKHFRRILLYGVGALLPLVVIFIFKMGYAPANDIVASDADGYVAKLTDVSRYLVVGEYYYKNLLSGSQLLLLLVVGAVFAFRWYREMPLWVGGAMLAGYFGIYILSPYGLDWHLGTSFNRLMHHLTPFLIYSAFVCIGQHTNFETLCVRLDSKQ